VQIHEFQAKRLFAAYDIPVLPSRPATTPEAAAEAAAELGFPAVVKAQIHAGGRGQAGGIVRAESPDEARRAAARLLGAPLVTRQTGPGGRIVRTLLVEPAANIAYEIYLGVVLDRARRQLVVIGSSAGGVEIEETARKDPEAIRKEWVDPMIGLRPFQAFRLARRLGLDGTTAGRVAAIVRSLVRLYQEKDCTLAEINPLAMTDAGEPIALDAKLTFDDNALCRRPEIQKLRDLHEEDPLEVEASAAHLNYIKLSGNVGCLVNGAGLAMATMDLIQLVGARPANFLDVGGAATAETIEKGVRILVEDKGVEAVFINIFGGILRCDVLAEGVIAAARSIDIQVPVIIRLEGTNVEAGRALLASSGLAFRTASDLHEAAGMIAAAARGTDEHLGR